jgi:hypothetical protein
MEVHLIDGTYELFRHFYALPSARDSEDREVATVRGVLGSILGMMQAGKCRPCRGCDIACASFRITRHMEWQRRVADASPELAHRTLPPSLKASSCYNVIVFRR